MVKVEATSSRFPGKLLDATVVHAPAQKCQRAIKNLILSLQVFGRTIQVIMFGTKPQYLAIYFVLSRFSLV